MLIKILTEQLLYNLFIFFNIITLKKKGNLIILTLIVLWLLNIFGSLTPDVRGYINILQIFKKVGVHHTEKIYYYIAKNVGYNIYFFRLIVSGIGYFLLYYYLRNKSLKYKKTYFVLFLLGFSFNSLNIIRLFLAATLFLNGFDLWMNSKKKSITFFILAVIFHKSYLPVMIIFFITIFINKKIKKNKKTFMSKVYIFYIISILLIIILKKMELLNIIFSVFNINKVYMQKNILYEGLFLWQIVSFLRVVLTNLLYIMFMIILTKIKHIEKEEIFSLIAIMLYFYTFIFFENTFISSRLITNCLPIIFISYTKVLIKYRNYKYKTPIYIYGIMFFLLENIMMTRYISWTNS